MNTERVGIFLQQLRKEKKLMQKDVAKLCNVSVQAVSKWERGGNMPDIETLERLSILYDVSINELINGEREEVYLDVEKRKNIIGIMLSALLFLVYLFPYIRSHMEIDAGPGNVLYEVTANGYELIFNATAFFMVPVWMVFAGLIAHLIVRVFTLTKVVNYTKGLKAFMLATSALILIISVALLVHDAFFAFPQILFAGAMLINMHLHYEKGDIQKLRERMKKREIEPLSQEEDRRTSGLKALTAFALLIGTVHVVLFFLPIIALVMGENVSASDLMIGFFAGLLPGVFILMLVRHLRGEKAKAFLLAIAVATIVFPLVMTLEWVPESTGEQMVFLTVYMVPAVFFLSGYLMYKRMEPSA